MELWGCAISCNEINMKNYIPSIKLKIKHGNLALGSSLPGFAGSPWRSELQNNKPIIFKDFKLAH